MQLHPYSVLATPELIGQLIFTPCPGTKDTSVSQALATLREAGASALVTLMPSEELLQNEIDLLPEECQLLGLEWFHLPVEDDQRPASLCCRLGDPSGTLESVGDDWQDDRHSLQRRLRPHRPVCGPPDDRVRYSRAGSCCSGPGPAPTCHSEPCARRLHQPVQRHPLTFR